jgi:hypothetical protein
LTDQILRVKHIEALLKLGESPNVKIIMTADDTTFLIELKKPNKKSHLSNDGWLFFQF